METETGRKGEEKDRTARVREDKDSHERKIKFLLVRNLFSFILKS